MGRVRSHLNLCSCHSSLNAAFSLQEQEIGGQSLRNPSRYRFCPYMATRAAIRLPV